MKATSIFCVRLGRRAILALAQCGTPSWRRRRSNIVLITVRRAPQRARTRILLSYEDQLYHQAE